MANKAITRFFLNDKVMLALVILNTVSIFVGGYFRDSYLFTVLDSLFTILFLLEAVVKIASLTFKGYWKDAWNRFDFVITLIALPSLMNLFVESGMATNIVLSLRALRVFKSFRLFKFIPNIENILKGIKLACKASFVVALGFGVLLLIVSILTSTLFGSAAPQYFGDPGQALYSTFKVFSVEGWYEIPDAIAATSGPVMGTFAKFYFVLFLFVGGILGLSLINAIFVDAAVSDNNDEVLARIDELDSKIEKLLDK